MAEYKVPVTDRFEAMLIGAERYACGRRTYIVSETVNYIVSLLPHLSMSTLLVFQNDVYTDAACGTVRRFPGLHMEVQLNAAHSEHKNAGENLPSLRGIGRLAPGPEMRC